MTTKRQPITASDLPPPITTAAGAPTELIAEDLPPAQPTPQAPTRFRQIGVSTIVISAVTPRARVQLAWDPPPGVPSVRYEVRWATDTGATANVGNGFSDELTARIDTLIPGTNYYFWVRTWAGSIPSPWSTRLGPILTASDDTAPGPVTSATASFATDGTLEVRATPPDSANFKTVRVEIWNGANAVQLDTSQFPGGLWTWSPTRNRAQTAAAGLGTVSTSVTVRLYAVSHTNIDSSVVTVAASSSAPSTPTGLTHTWSGDTGTAGADVIVTHTVVAGLAYYLSIDTLERQIIPGRYAYTYQQNAAEHSSTADPVLSLSLVAENGLGQRSTAATATATNAAPPATSIAVFGAFTMVGLTIGASAALDFQDFRVRVYVESVLERTIYLTALNTTYAVEDGNGNYTFDVATRDRFGQVGSATSQTAPVELVDQAEFIADLRAGLSYVDSIPTTPATLDGLKDDNTSTNVVTYTASTPWRWTEGVRALEVRHRKSTLSTSASASYYYGVSLDGVTYTWYAGGTATGGVWSPVAQASEAAAQTAATTLAAGIWRISLAATIEGRFFRLGHRNVSTSYALREFYPRSLVEADDINVESLSAISANLGAVTAGTITGLTIQTATSGARVVLDSSGLKTYNSAGQLVLQATTTTDGALKAYTTAGVNYYTLGSTGGQIVSVDTGGLDTLRSYRIVNSLGTYAAGYGGYSDEFGSALVLDATGRTSTDTTTGSANIDIRADAASSSASSSVLLRALLGTGPETEASLEIRNNGASDIGIYANGSISTNSGLNVGTATGAGVGQISAISASPSPLTATVSDAVTNASTRIVSLTHNSTGTPAAGFGASIRFGLETTTTEDQLAAEVVAQWATATHASRKGALVFQAVDSAGAREGLRIEASGSAAMIGFYGVAPIARQAVGSLTVSVGTSDAVVADVGASFNQTTLNNNFRDVADRINVVIAALENVGIIS